MGVVSQRDNFISWRSIARKLPGISLVGVVWLTCFANGYGAGSGSDSIIRPNSSLLYAVDPSPGMPVGFAWKLQVGSDGMVNLGKHGSVKVAGMTFAEAKAMIDQKIGVAESREKQAAKPKLGESLQRLRQVGQPPEVAAAVPPPKVSPIMQTGGTASASQITATPSAPKVIEPTKTVSESPQYVDAVAPVTSDADTQRDIKKVEIAKPDIVKAPKPASKPKIASPYSGEVVKTSSPVSRKETVSPPSTATLAYQSLNETKPAAEKAAKPVERASMPAKGANSKLVRLSKGRTAPAAEEPAPASAPMMTDRMPQGEIVQVGMRKAAGGSVQLAKGRAVAGPVAEPVDFMPPAPHECNTISLPPYVIHPPDILLIEAARSLRDQPINGQHLVRPDGTVGLGIYGSAYVAGLTIEQATAIIAHEIGRRVKDFDVKDLSVDVLAYNSKVYYVITDGGGFGEQVFRLPITGNETVLDAVAQINGLPPVASKKNIWVARPCSAAPCGQMILPVDWKGIASGGLPETNYQLFPGDRVYVQADKLITIDSKIAKVLSPVERLLGVTLLGSTTYNSISGRGFGFNN